MEKELLHFPGPSSLGVPGVPWHTQILADQLTLFQPGGDRLCPPNYFWPTQIFRPSDGPESLVPQIKLQLNSCQYPLIDYLGVNAP